MYKQIHTYIHILCMCIHIHRDTCPSKNREVLSTYEFARMERVNPYIHISVHVNKKNHKCAGKNLEILGCTPRHSAPPRTAPASTGGNCDDSGEKSGASTNVTGSPNATGTDVTQFGRLKADESHELTSRPSRGPMTPIPDWRGPIAAVCMYMYVFIHT